MSTFYVAQRVGTWEVLAQDLPLIVSRGPEWGLNMYGVLEGTLSPARANETAEDGHPVVAEWGTIISCDTGEGADRRRWQGIVDRVTPEGKDLKIRVRELAGYPDDLTFTGNIHGVRIDPAQVFRDMWADLQSARNGDLGVTVTGSTPLRVGTDSDLKAAAALNVRDAAKEALELRSKPRKAKEAQIRKVRDEWAPILRPLERARTAAVQAYDALVAAKAPESEVAAAKAVVTERQEALNSKREQRDAKIQPLQNELEDLRDAEIPWKEPYDEAEEAYKAAKEQAQKDGGGLKIEASDYPDTWREMLKLATEHGFEFKTQARWSDGKPDYRINIHYPSTGRARSDLIFQQGTNIISELRPRGSEYASEILGRGAGEGDEAIRAVAARTDWRVRRNAVLARPDISKTATLRAEVKKELGWALGDLEIPKITVRDHENAPLWSWAVGDSILVEGVIPHVGEYSEWHRIMSWALLTESTAELRLEKVSKL